MAGSLLVLIELGVVLGGVLALGLWELRVLRRGDPPRSGPGAGTPEPPPSVKMSR